MTPRQTGWPSMLVDAAMQGEPGQPVWEAGLDTFSMTE